MQCPRCGVENDGSHVACWNCFAPLESSGAVKPQKPPAPKAKAKISKPTDSVPTQPIDNTSFEPVSPQVVQDEASFISTDEPADFTKPDVPKADEEIPARPALDKDEPPSRQGYAIPGLAESSSEARAPREIREPSARPDKKFPAIIPIIFVVVAAAWWFLLANPSPVPAAKQYVAAIQSVATGNLEPMRAIVSATSQTQLRALQGSFGAMKRYGVSGVRMEPQEVVSKSVNGDTAEIVVTVKYTVPNQPMGMNMPMGVALVREGSILKRVWKVDLAATGRLQMKAFQEMRNKVHQVPGGMPSAPGR